MPGSASQRTSAKARRRKQPALPPHSMRVELEYFCEGTWAPTSRAFRSRLVCAGHTNHRGGSLKRRQRTASCGLLACTVGLIVEIPVGGTLAPKAWVRSELGRVKWDSC